MSNASETDRSNQTQESKPSELSVGQAFTIHIAAVYFPALCCLPVIFRGGWNAAYVLIAVLLWPVNILFLMQDVSTSIGVGFPCLVLFFGFIWLRAMKVHHSKARTIFSACLISLLCIIDELFLPFFLT